MAYWLADRGCRRQDFSKISQIGSAFPGAVWLSGSVKSIHAVFQSDGEWFAARCLDFPVTTQGKTLATARKNLQEAVELYLETWGDDRSSNH